jgi:hypothetical protein
MAYSGWDTQLGPVGSGCYAYTTVSGNIVTPHLWQQSGNRGDYCFLSVKHLGFNAGDPNNRPSYSNDWPGNGTGTRGPSTAVDGPNWYFGPWGSGQMCVLIEVSDLAHSTGNNGNSVMVGVTANWYVCPH